ncbi:MAG: DM13 domain-containing protein [bacterium]|nr:DM13 domain-containing protein [bacterium]
MDLIRRFKWPILGAGAVVLIVGFLLFRPDKLFVDDAINESLADAFPVATTSAPTTATTPTTTTTTPPADTDEQTTTTTTTTVDPEPTGPVVIASGDFHGIDHSASGTAAVYEHEGAHVLRFEDDTDIQNGPDLFVWVLERDSYDGGDPGKFIDLGKIKGNVGGQNYELPAEFDPDVHQFVLIWCKRFSVPFAASPLA